MSIYNYGYLIHHKEMLWFAKKLVSLHEHIQLLKFVYRNAYVVICWKISIFAWAYTTKAVIAYKKVELWFAEKLVSLHEHIQPWSDSRSRQGCCDLLKN